MAVEAGIGDIPNWMLAFSVAAITGLSGFVVGLINRGPAMQLAINSAVEPLLNGYKARVEELLGEVHALRNEVVILRETLQNTKDELRRALVVTQIGI